MSASRSGAVVWLTGMPASGKTTLALGLVDWLWEKEQPAALLDSDRIRKILIPESTFSEPERETFYTALAALAAELATQGLVVVVAATANRRRYREFARQMADRYIEIYVACDEAVRKERDPKGLYADSAAGKISNLPGDDVPYELPLNPDITIDTSHLEPDRALALLVQKLVAELALAGRSSSMY